MKNFMEIDVEFDSSTVELDEVLPVAMNAFGAFAPEASQGNALPAGVRELVSLAIARCMRGSGRAFGVCVQQIE